MSEPESGDHTVHIRTCPLCEATCGLEITMDGDQVVRIRGDRDDVFSHGFICPKGSTLKQLHEDPDRLRQPLVRRDGELQPASWDEAWQEIERQLVPILEAGGRDACALYLGQPERALPREHPLRATAGDGARLDQPLLGQHGRPDAEARVVRAAVR